MGFERRAVGHGHVQRRDAADGCFQFVEAALGDARGNLGGDATALMGFVGNDNSMGLVDRRKDRR